MLQVGAAPGLQEVRVRALLQAGCGALLEDACAFQHKEGAAGRGVPESVELGLALAKPTGAQLLHVGVPVHPLHQVLDARDFQVRLHRPLLLRRLLWAHLQEGLLLREADAPAMGPGLRPRGGQPAAAEGLLPGLHHGLLECPGRPGDHHPAGCAHRGLEPAGRLQRPGAHAGGHPRAELATDVDQGKPGPTAGQGVGNPRAHHGRHVPGRPALPGAGQHRLPRFQLRDYAHALQGLGARRPGSPVGLLDDRGQHRREGAGQGARRRRATAGRHRTLDARPLLHTYACLQCSARELAHRGDEQHLRTQHGELADGVGLLPRADGAGVRRVGGPAAAPEPGGALPQARAGR
mmetsp:Transcript_111928/g.311597  ORF Transcript_111928/g.311597 Transcript_111928/m.311597 type:complete len:350 (-) Transcript_111928:675-1724(-)